MKGERGMSVLERHITTKQSELQATAPVENGGGSHMVYETDYKACEAYLINFIYSNHVSSMIKIKIKNERCTEISQSEARDSHT